VTDLIPQGRKICRFWPRIWALAIDSVILGIAGSIAGAFLFDRLASLGESGRWIGFFVAVIYGGVLNSCLGRGQTVGKRLLRIQVVANNGGPISLPRSLLREAIFVGPFIANGFVLPAAMLEHPLGRVFAILYTFAEGFLGISIVYLYLFNRPSRQSAHDLIAGTYVVDVIPEGPVLTSPLRARHRWILASFAGLILLMSWGGRKLSDTSLFGGMLAVIEKIEADGRVSFAAVYSGSEWTSRKSPATLTDYEVTVVMKSRPAHYEETATEIARVVLATDPRAFSRDVLSITIGYGYDIGIAHGRITREFTHTPAQWRSQP